MKLLNKLKDQEVIMCFQEDINETQVLFQAEQICNDMLTPAFVQQEVPTKQKKFLLAKKKKSWEL